MEGYRFCNSCKIEHPFTEMFWRYDTDYWRCRIKKRKQEAEQRRVGKYKDSDYVKNRVFTKRYAQLKRVGKATEREVTITLNQYTQIVCDNCYYCNGQLPETGYGLDRVDNTKAYSIENIVPCCSICNIAKRALTTQEFFGWLARANETITSRKLRG